MDERLKLLREDKELSQDDISKILNITRQNYSRWETGELFAPLTHLNTLANYYNTNIDYLCGLSKDPTPTKAIKEINRELVGKRINTIRTKNNLSMRALAKVLNTSHSTISGYESGNTLIIISFALELASKYDVSLDWLIGRKN